MDQRIETLNRIEPLIGKLLVLYINLGPILQILLVI